MPGSGLFRVQQIKKSERPVNVEGARPTSRSPGIVFVIRFWRKVSNLSPGRWRPGLPPRGVVFARISSFIVAAP